jgi:hypothetical protein
LFLPTFFGERVIRVKGFIKIFLKVFLIIMILAFVLIGMPLILLHMKTLAPTEQYVESSETAFYTALDQELSALIIDSEEDNVFLRLDEAFINRIIQKKLAKDNPKYLNPDYEGEIAHDYMQVFGRNTGLKGVWTELSDDQIVVTAGADFVVNGRVLYQTGLEIIFDIVLSENDAYYLKVAKIQVGRLKLPLNQALKLADFIITQLTDNSLNDLIAEHLSFGVFEPEEFSFTVSETELTEYLYQIEPSFAALLKVVYKESLLIMDVSDEGFDITIQIGEFRRLLTDLDEPNFTKWDNDLDKVAFMADLALRAAPYLLDPRIDLSEADVNAILDYTLADKIQFEFPIEFTLSGEEIVYSFTSTNLFVRMQDDFLSIHLRMTLTKAGMAGSFDMQFNLKSSVWMNASGDMVLTIIDANLGEVILDADILATLFAIFDDTLMVGNTIVIPKEKLNEMFEGSGLVFNDCEVIDDELRLYIGLDS